MRTQLVNRNDPERILVNILNAEASSATTGFGMCFAMGNEDVVASANGVDAVFFTRSAELNPAFIGVAQKDIAANTYGPVIAWGYASVALSQEANVTVGLLAGNSLLIGGAQQGTFTSAAAAWETASTLVYKYVVNVTTQSTNGGINYTAGFVRAL